MRIVFWQNMMAFHQSAHIRALADTPGWEVVWVVQETLRPERAAMGWPIPDPGGARVVVGPSAQRIREIADESDRDTVHVFGGTRSYELVRLAVPACLRTPATLGILSERSDHRGVKGLARLLRGRLEAARLGRRVSFILAIGRGAPEWFQACGYLRERIYPYGYLMETPERLSFPERDPNGVLRLLFLGQFIPRKGGDVLLRGLAGVAAGPWRLRMVGGGPTKAGWSALADRLGLSPQVELTDAMPHAECMQELEYADLLVLPSTRKEGWGAVVSEALMRGVPAICTDECGAADLLRERWRGEVVRARSVPALSAALERWIAKGPRTSEQTERIVEWSKCIRGEVAAAYMLDVIRHARGDGPRPEVPWWAGTTPPDTQHAPSSHGIGVTTAAGAGQEDPRAYCERR